MTIDPFLLARTLAITGAAFMISVLTMPLLIRVLRKYKMGKSIRAADSAPIMSSMHQAKSGTPTMGGIVIWATVLVLVLGLAGACALFGDGSLACRVNFLSRGQTWLPLGLMFGAALIGLVDDYLNILRIGSKGGGLRERERILSYGLIAVIGALWFFLKLGWDYFHIPFVGTFEIGWWYVPFFILVIISTSHSVNVTDGLDGLAGGILLSSFAAFSIIAWSQGRYDLATLCGAICGALLGFLWYNINPADVFMGDTGAMSLGTTLGVIALLTNQPLLLLVSGLPYVVESLSVIIQLTSKKLRNGKKVFKVAPIHHHFEASGWSEPRVVMRFWMISFVMAGLGILIGLLDKT